MRRLKSRSFAKNEIGLLALGAFLVVVVLAVVGVPSITTRHTETRERTTTQKVPVPLVPKPEIVKPKPQKIVTKKEIIELRREVKKKIQTARSIIHQEVTQWCLAHDNCKGETGVQGAKGERGTSGQDGRDASAVKPEKGELDSSVLALVDDTLRGVETTVGGLLERVNSLTGRVTLLERILGALCRVLTPGRCA